MKRVYQRQTKPRYENGKKVHAPWEDVLLRDICKPTEAVYAGGPFGSLSTILRRMRPGDRPVYTLSCRFRVIEVG